MRELLDGLEKFHGLTVSRSRGAVMEKLKVVIIGAGIVGASIARVLSMFENLDVVIVEKAPDAGWGVTRANTALIHGCYADDPSQYPMRARLCIEGARLWRKWIEELSIPAEFPGALVIAFNEEEVDILYKLLDIGERNGVPSLSIVHRREELERLEPNISPNALAALWSPTVGFIDPFEATIALIENAVDNGVKTYFETEVIGIRVDGGSVTGVETNRGFIEADIVINAAGLYADKISKLAGVEEFVIKPRRGQYMIFDRDAEPKVRRVLFPTPTPITKGVVVTRTTEGNLMIGPNAEDLPIESKEDDSTTVEGLEFVWREASKLVKALPPRSRVIRVFAGIRPEPHHGDFVVKGYRKPYGFINAAGTRSPGLTAAPAIACEVVRILRDFYGIDLVEKKHWKRYREPITRFRDLDHRDRARLIEQNPDYGIVICRHMLVTKAEIVQAIERIKKIGAVVTLRGIKYRTKASMGICQGGFCIPMMARIVAEHLGIGIHEVRFGDKGSELGIGDIYSLVKVKSFDC